jgi:uncharacterized protein YbjT (DUF2867 family)
MKQQTALVLGATGLIGSNVVTLLLEDYSFDKVRVLVRREYNIDHPKLEVEKVNFQDPEEFSTKVGKGDAIFCCVGTTMNKVKGDKVAYRKIDYDIAVNAANFGLAGGYTKYLLVSSIGANAKSKNFYLKLKGETENAVSSYTYKSLHIFQPSFLLGKRNEVRIGEVMGKGVMQGLSIFFFGSLSKYKAIDAETVAKAMVAASKIDEAGRNIYTYSDIINLNKS